MRLIAALLLSVWLGSAGGAINAYEFDSPEQEASFKRLSEELRCLVCQNQNLADSNAELAQDLRREIYRMIREGKDEQAVIDFMVARYGDFVRYRPPVNSSTYLLWAGPFVLLVVAAVTLIIMIRKRGAAEATETLSAEERSRLDTLLRSHTGERREP